MSRVPVELQLVNRWTTKIVRRGLAGIGSNNAALEALIADVDAHEADYTVRYQEQNFFARTEPPVQWLKGEIDETVASYLDFAGVGLDLKWTVEGWYNVNRLGDHHSPHNHPGSYLSGTYYVRVPSAVAEDVAARAGAHPACISFHDPRAAANMLALGEEPDAHPVHVVRPEPGTLMMWPSPVQHYVHPNQSHEHRISISFNIVLDAPWGTGG